MVLSRSSRITLLLIIDALFFFVELIVGYAVGSLALVADSFHMLNDVMSLVVALYAIKMTSKTETDARYSYGWHRAEILAALINGVFLLALCLSIFLEAMGRFFSTPEIGNPKLVVIVGACGLASNIVGLFLFHEHGHSHDHADASVPSHKRTDDDSTLNTLSLRSPIRSSDTDPQSIPSRVRSDSITDTYGHPAALRASFSQAAEEIRRVRSPSPPARRSHQQSVHNPQRSTDTIHEDEQRGKDDSPPSDATLTGSPQSTRGHIINESTPLLAEEDILDHTPTPRKHASGSGHSHGHGSMNMKAILLHVLGDALGNVGVIATGLIIWLTTWSFKFYFDPIISVVITVIIFSSALPLVRSTAFILLQGVPPAISLEEVRDAILQVKGVLSLHELHIWQLSESKVVASVHVTASRDHDFMHVAAEIQEALHHRGIHSSTIQPEYTRVGNPSRVSECSSCLIGCPRDMLCSPDNTCCPPPSTGV
jgi:zinc transporter 1